MKTFLNPAKLSALLALLILTGCSTTKQTENMLSAAGFKIVVAATPKQEQKLKALPPGKVTTVQRNGKTYFVFPDAAHNRIYLGNQQQYQNYQQMLLDQKIAVQNRGAGDMVAADGSDWSDWGPWDVLVLQPN